MTNITTAIYNEYYNLYSSPNFSDEMLQGYIEELGMQSDLALEHYYLLEETEELAERAWQVYDTIRMYNWEIIKAIGTILDEREKETK